MNIKVIQPPAPPREIEMRFSITEGWAVIAALQEYAAMHPKAANVEQWGEWVYQLYEKLRP